MVGRGLRPERPGASTCSIRRSGGALIAISTIDNCGAVSLHLRTLKAVVSIVKRLVCLANSRKLSGRCVAGKELVQGVPGVWIRPVSDRPKEEVSKNERQYEDGSDPRLLDMIDVPLKEPRPRSYQSENWLLDPASYWRRVGRTSWSGLATLADDPPALWLNGYRTEPGLNDRVPLADTEGLVGSLYLLHLQRLELRVFAPGEAFGNAKRRVQAVFTHRGTRYELWVTDPLVADKYLALPNGSHPVGECFATISLGEPYEGYCYKLVAGLMTRGDAA